MTPKGGEAVGILHVHSDYSHDGRDSLEHLGDLAAERGIRFVGLTDHAEDLTAEEYAGYVRRCAAVGERSATLLPGLEFRFAGYPGLHLLAVGLYEWMAPDTPADFLADAKSRRAFTIVAHPILTDYQVPDEVRAGIDAVEVWNASYNTRYLPDPQAIRLLHRIRRIRPEVVGIAGLDQHDAANDRETRVILHREADDPVAALRAGRFRNRGRTLGFDAAVTWGPVRLGALSVTRAALDRVERIQERVARRLRARRPS